MIVGAGKHFQGSTTRHVQARQLIENAHKFCQSGTARDVQVGQLIPRAVKLCYVATDGDRLASEPVGLAIEIVRFPSLLSPLNGDVAIGFDAQIDFLTDPLRGGHGDDALGEEGGESEERAEENEEPDA